MGKLNLQIILLLLFIQILSISIWAQNTKKQQGKKGKPCGELTVKYAEKTYHTVQIGDQCWLKENLDAGTMIKSEKAEDNQADNKIIEKYCYNNDPANCETYGGLYQWNEAMQYITDTVRNVGVQGICPAGWHIPTYSEFEALMEAVGRSGDALKAVAQETGKKTSGFSALNAGERDGQDGKFRKLEGKWRETGFWSTLGGDLSTALIITGTYDNIKRSSYNKATGFSVRCIKD